MTNGMDVKTKMKRSCESRTMRFPRRIFHCPRKEGRPTSLQLTESGSPQALLEDQWGFSGQQSLQVWARLKAQAWHRVDRGFCAWTRAIVGLRRCWDAAIGPTSSTCSVWGRWEAALGQVWPLSSSCGFTRSETISWGRFTALRGTWIWKDQWLEARACPRPGSATRLVFKLSVYSLTSLDPQCPHLQNGKIIIKIAMWLYYNKGFVKWKVLDKGEMMMLV